MSYADGPFAGSEQPGLRPPRLGAYHQLVSLRRKPVPVTAGPYLQAAQNDDQAEIDDEEEFGSIPTPYEPSQSTVANNEELSQRSSTPPPKWPQRSHPTLWAPIWLTRAALVAFAATFLLMLLATALLYRFSQRDHGLSVQREANHYAWKYGPTADPRFAWSVGPGPAQTYYGVNFYGLRYPSGTAQDFVIPEFQVPSVATDNLKYSMTTEGLKVHYDCEILPLTNGTTVYMPWRSILGQFIVANVTTKDCNIKGVTLAAGPDHYYYHDRNASQNYQSQFTVYPCNADWDFSRQFIERGDLALDMKIYNISKDMRIFMSVVDLRISPWDPHYSSPSYMYLHNVTAALCKPSYELGKFHIGVPNAVNGSAQAVFSAPAAAQKVLKTFPQGALTMAVESSARAWDLGNGGVDFVLSATVPTFFQLMSKKAGFESIRNFMDPDLLLSTGSDVFKGIAAQLLHQVVVQPGNRNITGSITYSEQRLRVKAISTGFMCGFLGLLFILSVVVIFVRPGFAAPDRPGSAFSMATLLASSHRLNEILSPMGSLSNEGLHQGLSEYQFRTVHSSHKVTAVSIEPVQRNEGQTTSHATNQGQSQVPSWRPIASTTWFLILAICLPLSVIASLEIVQHFSDVNHGFMSISQSSSLAFATYIPSAVAIGVASIYSSMQMMAATFAPYAPLRRGKASAERTVRLNLVGQLLPRALFLSLRTKNFAVAIALLGSFIGSFLSIIVSGLYSVADVSIIQSVELHQGDTFNFDNVDISLSEQHEVGIWGSCIQRAQSEGDLNDKLKRKHTDNG
ncbi:hypothetical protein TARUN_674 [Trichoderma arundinaceum]|uniref:Uncharacterized protein n=1 Tax=Trichoderma arundinaceum TaxID=490622 RepID=A0A395NZJ2_TRIAR|nr:hypothetical protein TARUN_674 [Trichoderma arundinaceum]